MTDLFEIPESLSPYLQWERDNRIKTHESDNPDEWRWYAVQTDYSIGEHFERFGYEGAGQGETREEAISNLVKLNNIKPFGADQIK